MDETYFALGGMYCYSEGVPACNLFKPQPLPRPGLKNLFNGLPTDPGLPGWGDDQQPQWLLRLDLNSSLSPRFCTILQLHLS